MINYYDKQNAKLKYKERNKHYFNACIFLYNTIFFKELFFSIRSQDLRVECQQQIDFEGETKEMERCKKNRNEINLNNDNNGKNE